MNLIATIDALIEHYATTGKIGAAKFWADTIRTGAVDLSAAMPDALSLYRNWVREACRETGVREIEIEEAA